MICRTIERKTELERTSGANATPATKKIFPLLAGVSIAASALWLSSVPAFAASNYVPPIVTTASTTLYSTTTAIAPGRVAIDAAGNTFYMVNGGSSSTLMEIPAASPAVTNTAPLTLVTGLGQYNANTAFVDVKGNLWVSVGNGTASLSTGTDYLSLIEIPAVGGIPNAAAIPAGGETLSALDVTHCSSTTTVPCAWQNYKLNSPSSNPINGPQVADLFVDGSGNVYFVDVYDNTSKGAYNVLGEVNLLTGGTATVLATNLPSSGRSQVAVDAGGNVFYFDSTTSLVSQVSGGTLTTVGTSATIASALIASPTGISADFYGNLYIGNASQLSEVPFEGTAANFADEFGIVNGLSAANTNSISYGGGVDGNGNYYYAYNSSSTGTKIKQLQVNGYNFGAVTIGTLVTGPSLTIYFNAAETSVSSYFPTGSPTANTLPALLQSFPYSGTKSFSGGTSFTAGQAGTITMNFQPIHPGLLKGSFTPRSNGVNDTIVNLQGNGLGPQTMFLPGIASSLFTSAATSSTVTTQVPLNGPLGLAVDTYGDIFVADQGNGKVVADCLATTTANVSGNGSGTTNSFCGNTGYLGAVVELGTGFTKPADIALDGANNLYVVDNTANTVTEISGVNLAATTLVSASTTFDATPLSSPRSIAIDGYTNVYIADSGNNRIVKAHQFGAAATDNVVLISSTATFGGTALSNPTGIALDASGNLFIADKGNNRIVEYTALGVGSVVSTTGITLVSPTAVKVLPSGTLVVTDSGNNVSLVAGGAGTTLPIGTLAPSAPQGIALDLAGNLYLSDTSGNRVLELAVSAPASIAFPSTPQGGTSSASTTKVSNSGSAVLSFSSAPSSSSANFSVLSSGTCTASSTVAAGAACTVLTDFTPQTTGALTGTVTLTDSQPGYTLNTATSSETATFATTGTQGIPVTGTGTTATVTAATPIFAPGTGTYTAVQSVTISDTTSGASIYYTTDGTTPTPSSKLYSGPITVSATQTIQAIATAAGDTNSAIASATYTINLAPVKPAVVMSQTTVYGKITSGAVLDGGNPAGNSMAVNSAGTVIASTTYGGQIDQFTAAGSSVLATFSNPGPVAVDSTDNLYIAATYNATITKVPYVAGAYVAISTPTGSTPTCTGADVTECVLPKLSSAVSGIEAMYFDASGDLFFTSVSGSSPNAIFECSAACLKSSTPSATLLYQEPVSSTAQLYLGGLAADKFGDLFFTDSLTTTGSLTSSSSNLKQLTAATGGTGFATTPITLYTYTNATPGSYDNQLDAVAVDAKGTVYFATENDGIFAFLGTSGTINTGTLYTVSTQGAKALTTDGNGNFYAAAYNNTLGTDAVSKVAVGNLTAPTVAIGSTSTATNVQTVLNDATCSATPTVSYAATVGGVTNTEFSAATTGKCSSTLVGSTAYPTTLTFKPSATGTRTATLTATDSNGGTGTATVTGIGSALPNAATPTFNPVAGTYTTIQPVTISDATTGATIYYTTNGTTPTTASSVYAGPISVGASQTINAIATATGYNTSAVGSAAYVINLPAATPAFSPMAGTYTTIQSVAISDATTGATIYYTTDGSTPTTSSTIYSGAITVAVSQTIMAIATATGSSTSAVGSAIYVINLPPVATPVILPGSNTFTSTQSVTITDSIIGAKIYYTVDGTTPTTSSSVYTGALTVGVSETVKAIAVAAGYSTSAIASASYVINLPAPNFTMSINPPAISIANGSSRGVDVIVTSVGAFNAPVTFSCSGLPSGSSCSFSPASVTPISTGASTTLTVTAPARSATLHLAPGSRMLATSVTLAIALCFMSFRKRRRFHITLMLAIGTIGFGLLSGCGSTTETPTTANVTITGTAGTVTQTAMLSVTLQ